MRFDVRAQVVLGLILGVTVFPAVADPITSLVTDVEVGFLKVFVDDENILVAAKTLFVSLATISLVWTMGLHVVRQDLGDVLMELLRFMIVTGTFYWLLINASSHAGGDDFVQRIVGSFYQMANNDSGGAFRVRGNSAVTRALHVYMKVMDNVSTGQDADRIVGGFMGVMVLVALTLLAAQFLLALVMAWLLGYGGIFLLGFGGARWTSQIAINYYKHVVALGVAILALGVIGQVSEEIFSRIVPSFGVRTKMTYVELGLALTVSLLMLVLGLRVPQLLYTLVTGSSLGMFAGMAGMAGSAIATGGGAALASAGGRHPKGGGADPTSGSTGSVARSSSAMEAIERSAVSASAMADPFHVAGGSDPFGVSHRPDAHRGPGGGSVFGAASSAGATTAVRGDGSNGGESSDLATVASGTAVAGAGSYAATVVAGPTGSAGQVGSGWQAGVTEGRAGSSLLSSEEQGGASHPDYLAEMSAIAAARADETAYQSATLERAGPSFEYPPARGRPDVSLSTSASATHSADVTQAASETTTSNGVDSEFRTEAVHQDSGAQAQVMLPTTDPQFVTSPTVDSQHGAASGHGGIVHLTPGSIEHRIDAMASAPAEIHLNVTPVERLNADATPSGGQNVETSVAGAALAPPETGRTQGATSVHADSQQMVAAVHVTPAAAMPSLQNVGDPVPATAKHVAATSVSHESKEVASETSENEGQREATAVPNKTDSPAQRLHAQSALSALPPTDRPALAMGSAQSAAIDTGGIISTSIDSRSAQNSGDEIAEPVRYVPSNPVREPSDDTLELSHMEGSHTPPIDGARQTNGNNAVRRAEAERARAESSDDDRTDEHQEP